MAEYARYHASGEINSRVADQAEATARVKQAFASRPGVSTDQLDGLTVVTDDWWFNVRPSNTEPLLRLNVEASDETTVAALRDEVLGIVRTEPAATGGQIGPAATGGQIGPAATGGQIGPAATGGQIGREI
jgi:phosphomannomutase